jgi:superfamily II DNA helicase RecQ
MRAWVVTRYEDVGAVLRDRRFHSFMSEMAQQAEPDPAEVLHRVFGHPGFRGRQEEIIRHVVAGGSGLVLMPTGGGK